MFFENTQKRSGFYKHVLNIGETKCNVCLGVQFRMFSPGND